MKKISFKLINFLLVSILSIMLISCNNKNISNNNEETLYQKSIELFKKKQYLDSIEYFSQLKINFPLGKRIEDASLYLMEAYYYTGDYQNSISESNRFIHLYNKHTKNDFAYYIKGISLYQKQSSFLRKLSKIKYSDNSIKEITLSFNTLSKLVSLYPKSKYSPKAKKIMTHLRNIIARKELSTAKFYLKRKAYLASIKRANNIVKYYQGTNSVLPALKILYKSYKAIGLTKEANNVKTLLDINN